ncbi:MFS transporter [Reticulibacter mediterranei]|uniref:MFS transporter n=1 Tax=Reticulibacter mediterranei TaxID=2778369 RepID=A0A8J3N669_9CHLR|nr:MFS transporter [Reticulibacter mediterranei]GHP00028.1 MFS transporter [Reticulibacter mediterranei]
MADSQQTRNKTRSILSTISSFSGSPVLRNRTLLAVSLAVFAAYVGIGMVAPVRILYAESRGASLAIIDAMASAFLISNFIFQYPVGWLADRWGRKPVMIAGLLIQAALSALYLPITDPLLFIALRFLEGMASAALLPAARALIVDAVSSDQQGEAFGIFGAFFNAGFLLGPGLGGLLATLGYASAFIGAVLFRLIGVVLVIFLIQGANQNRTVSEKRTTTAAIPYRSLFRLPLIGAYLIAFGDYLYLGFDLTLTPIWLHNNLGATVTFIGFAYMMWAVPNVLLSPVGGRVADKKRRSFLILLCGLAQVPIYLAYGLVNMALLVAVLFAVHGIIYAFMQPAIDSHVASSSDSAIRAQVQGLYTTFGLIGAFVGSSGFTPLYSINFRLPLFTMGITYGLCVLLGGLLIRLAEKRSLQ